MSDYETILYTETDGVAWVTMNRPEARNALNRLQESGVVAGFRLLAFGQTTTSFVQSSPVPARALPLPEPTGP